MLRTTLAVAVSVGALFLAACAGPTLESGQSSASAPLVATIDHVVDGDTIVVNIGDRTETIRLLGIDTPEKPGGPRPAECFGTEASQFASRLLPPGTEVLLTRDIDTRDQFGRLLAYVHRSADGLFINYAMVHHGYATTLFFAPNTAAKPELSTAANGARRAWIGFWPACGQPDLTLTPNDE